MRKLAACLVAMIWLASIPAAHACSPVFHPNPAADFISDARINPAAFHVIFTGDILSVSEYRDTHGDLVRDTAVRTDRWWLGDSRGVVLVRSITPKEWPPCSPPPPLEAKEGERWLIFGWAQDGRIRPYTDPRVTLRLEHGSLPTGMARELERIGHGPHPG